MTVEFKLPELGENIEAGDVVGILVAVGDQVEPNQPVLELETDKATIEVPIDTAGKITEIFVITGDKATVGQPVFTLEPTAPEADTAETPATTEPAPAETKAPAPSEAESEAAAPEPDAPAAPSEAPPAPGQPRRTTLSPETSPDPQRSQVPAAPNLRRLAREIGVDITQVEGTGPQGRLTMADVKRQARHRVQQGGGAVSVTASPLPDFAKWGAVRREPMSNLRRAAAEHLSQAWATIPHVTQFDQADIQEVEALRKRFAPKAEQAGGKLTITAILLKIAGAALKAFPKFNASLDMENQEIIYKDYFHIGVAVDTERGLLVPVIRDVDRKNIFELAVELSEVAQKARDRKLTLEEMQGGNFSITNLGGIGGTNFTPIVNAPEVAILGVARGRIEPVYRDGQFEPRLMLPLALSYDHRLIDGADAARFLRWVVEALEEPVLMSLQGW